MELYLIRHGQSANNALPVEQRTEDPTLTDLGRKQVEHSANWAETANLTRLFTSPFRRTLETTEPFRRATGLTPEVRVDLHEEGGCVAGVDLPSFRGRPGMTRAEILDDFPGYHLPDEIDGAGWWKSQPHETTDQAVQRANRLLQHTRDEFAHTNERVAYVMHGNFKYLLLCSLLQLPKLDVPTGEEICNTSVTKIILTPHETRLDFFNNVDHLPDEMVT